MKKILVFVDTLNEGGVSKVLVDFIENIDKKKYDITVMSLYNTGPYISTIKKHVKYKYCFNLPNDNDQSMRAYLYRRFWGGMLKLPERFMYRWFVKEKYDIEVAFMHGWSTKFISASSNKKSKKVAWVHADLITWDRVDGVFKNIEHHKRAYSKFDKVICVSNIVKKGIEDKYEVKNAQVIYNPLNKDRILQQSLEEVNEFSVKASNFNIISVGRLSYEKGYDCLLSAFNKLIRDGLKCNLWIVGSGGEYTILNNYILTNGLDDYVKLLGFKDNPYKYMRNSDLFVCSSRSEGFSLVIAEAMVIGVPIVSVDCPGPNELLDCGKYGLLVENNEEKLYLGLKKMINNEELYRHYTTKSRERGNFFCLEDFIHAVEDIFSDL